MAVPRSLSSASTRYLFGTSLLVIVSPSQDHLTGVDYTCRDCFDPPHRSYLPALEMQLYDSRPNIRRR